MVRESDNSYLKMVTQDNKVCKNTTPASAIFDPAKWDSYTSSGTGPDGAYRVADMSNKDKWAKFKLGGPYVNGGTPIPVTYVAYHPTLKQHIFMAVEGVDLKMVTSDNTQAKNTAIGSGTPETVFNTVKANWSTLTDQSYRVDFV